VPKGPPTKPKENLEPGSCGFLVAIKGGIFVANLATPIKALNAPCIIPPIDAISTYIYKII
jgi:hypothetical protein